MEGVGEQSTATRGREQGGGSRAKDLHLRQQRALIYRQTLPPGRERESRSGGRGQEGTRRGKRLGTQRAGSGGEKGREIGSRES